jgi:hypothetical protein
LNIHYSRVSDLINPDYIVTNPHCCPVKLVPLGRN